MDIKQNFIKSLLSGGGTFILKALLSVLLIPLMVAHLGTENYGFYLLLVGLSDFMMLMDTGLTTGLIQRISHYRSVNQQEKIQEQLRIAQWLYALMVVGLIALGLLLTPVLIHSFSLSETQKKLAVWLFPLVVIDGAINLYGCYFQAVLKSHCIYHWNNIMELVQSFLVNGGSVILLLMGYGLLEIMLLRLVVTMLKNIVILNRTLQIEKHVFQWCFNISRQGVTELFSISLFAMIQQVSVVIAHNIDNFVIAAFLTMTDVTCFGLVAKLFGYMVMFCLKLTEAVFPMFAYMEAIDRTVTRQFFIRISCFINYAIGAPLIVASAFYPEIIRFLGAGQIQPGQVLGVTFVFIPLTWSVALQIPASNYLFACGRHRLQTYSSLITALCNLGLSLILIRQIGLVGVAVGTLIPHVIQHQLISIRTACQQLNISWRDYLYHVHIRNLAPLGFLAVSLAIARAMLGWYAPHLLLYAFTAIVLLMGSCVLWVALAASEEEQKLLYKYVNKYIPSFGSRWLQYE